MEHWPKSLCWIGDWMLVLSMDVSYPECLVLSWVFLGQGKKPSRTNHADYKPSNFSKASRYSQKNREECDSLHCHILVVWSWETLISLTGFIGLFPNLRGRARKGNVSLGVYVISSLRLAFMAPFLLLSCVICMISVFAAIKWAYVKSSFKNPWDVVFSVLALCLAWK